MVSEGYSTEYRESLEPYYPVNDDCNNALADKYRRLAEQEVGVIFGGRLDTEKTNNQATKISKKEKEMQSLGLHLLLLNILSCAIMLQLQELRKHIFCLLYLL